MPITKDDIIKNEYIDPPYTKQYNQIRKELASKIADDENEILKTSKTPKEIVIKLLLRMKTLRGEK